MWFLITITTSVIEKLDSITIIGVLIHLQKQDLNLTMMHVFDRIKVTIRFLVEANEHENAPFLEKDA